MNKQSANNIIQDIKDTMKSNGFNYDYHFEELEYFLPFRERKEGKKFTFSEHLSGLIYSLLSNQRPWGPIAKNTGNIDKIFYGFDKDIILNTDKDIFSQGLKEIKCGNRAIDKQMDSLKYNITKMEEIENEYGSLDNFIESNTSHHIAIELSQGNRFKLKQIGYALAQEYLRNTGIDTAKPDVHLRRILSSQRLGLSAGYPSEDETMKIVIQMGKDTGLNLSYIDGLLWIFCSLNYANICGAVPKCYLCKLSEYCNKK